MCAVLVFGVLYRVYNVTNVIGAKQNATKCE